VPLRDVLVERREPVIVNGRLGDWQAITIKFSGAVIPRDRADAFKGAMFAAYPGDLLFSKIDARNGAIGLIPETIEKAVVTSEYPVFIPKPEKLRPLYLRHLLQAAHFRADLQSRASGTSGRKRVTPESFLSLSVPLPTLEEQDALMASYTSALDLAAQQEQDAHTREREGLQAFESALGVAAPPPLPDRPVFIAQFKDLERWSHEGILDRSVMFNSGESDEHYLQVALGDVIADLENGWSPKCLNRPAKAKEWGVLKLGAVSFGEYDELQNKALPAHLKPKSELEVRQGEVLISRANVIRLVGACAIVRETRSHLMLCDKIFRVVFREKSPIDPEFLAEAMKLSTVRQQIEAAATGTSPTMKNISKPSLLSLTFPIPRGPDGLKTQQKLISALRIARASATSLRQKAKHLRSTAWTSFESSIFDETKTPADSVFATNDDFIEGQELCQFQTA
jgi:type I restriction enzyme S subunit